MQANSMPESISKSDLYGNEPNQQVDFSNQLIPNSWDSSIRVIRDKITNLDEYHELHESTPT